MRSRVVDRALAGILFLLCWSGIGFGQTDTSGLLGRWAGEQWTRSGTGSKTLVEVHFSDDSGTLRWELEIVSMGRGFGSKASGTATVTDGLVQLNGKYSTGPGTGSPLSYSLQLQGDSELSGTGLGSRQAVFNAVWKRLP